MGKKLVFFTIVKIRKFNGGSKKITVDVPVKLLKDAQAETGEGISETVRQALELLAARSAYKKVKNLRGNVTFSHSLDDMKDDRT